MSSREKLRFPTRLRELRLAAGKKQHEVARVLAIEPGSYSNAESANHKRISRDRVLLLAKFYSLDQMATAELLADWEALPASAWSEGQSAGAKAKRSIATKAKASDELALSLVEVLSLLVEVAPDPDALCCCAVPATDAEFGAPPPPCEVCKALQRVGLTGWTNRDEVVAQLAKVQEGLAGG